MDLLFRGTTDLDTAGGTRTVVTTAHSTPCRRCLTDVEPGEVAVLTSHDPFPAGTDSPYRSASPVFVHDRACPPYVGAAVPEQQRRRLLSVRAFDADARMLGAHVVPGTDLERHLQQAFADPRAEVVHVHNAAPGCFAVRVERS